MKDGGVNFCPFGGGYDAQCLFPDSSREPKDGQGCKANDACYDQHRPKFTLLGAASEERLAHLFDRINHQFVGDFQRFIRIGLRCE